METPVVMAARELAEQVRGLLAEHRIHTPMPLALRLHELIQTGVAGMPLDSVRGTCGHHWRPDERTDCPVCALASHQKVATAAATQLQELTERANAAEQGKAIAEQRLGVELEKVRQLSEQVEVLTAERDALVAETLDLTAQIGRLTRAAGQGDP